ncbi:Ferrous iron transport protein A [Klebsiella variicola]|nr:Ferrous iron transport protein A [Klebsiella variicola]
MRHIKKKVIFAIKIAFSASYVLMIKTILIIIIFSTLFPFSLATVPGAVVPDARSILLRLAIHK